MNQPVTLTMFHRYPFDCIIKDNQIIEAVKLRRKFEQYEYPHLRSKIQRHSNIKHDCLIKIIKAFQSRKKSYFDIVFEWVPYSLRNIARSLNYAQLQEKKLALLQLVSRLIRSGLHPAIAEDLIGITQNKQIKLYVDVDFSPILGPAEELIRAKQIQISNIFKLYQRASLFELPRSPRNSMHQILGNQSTFQYHLQNSKFLSPQHTHQNRDIYLDKMKKSKSPIIISKRYDNEIVEQVRRFPQLLKGSTQKTLFGSISNLVQGNQNEGPSIQQAINSQNSFEQKQLKYLKPETERKLNQQYQFKSIENRLLQDKVDKEDKIQIMRQPRLFKLAMKQQKQQSQEQSISIVDTYKQQLGQTIKMPKLSNTQFRQTTKEPPIIMNFSEQKSRKMSITNSDLKNFRKQKSKSPIKSIGNNQIKSQKKQEQIKKKTQYTAQNSYYYKQILGIGVEKNNPITQQFISLLGDDFMVETPNANQPEPNTFQEITQQKIQPKSNNLNQINDKVKQALQNSQRTFDMFQKFKQNQEK